LAFVTFGLFSGNLSAGNIGIATGSKQGTYYHIAKNIKQACEGYGTIDKIEVHDTDGSYENISLLLNSSNIQFAIVQEDSLLIRNILEDGKIARSIKAVYPLYKEQIHLLTLNDNKVNKLSDLNGKNVSVGETDSGSDLTYRVFKELKGLRWNTKHLSTKKALMALINEEIDAIFFIAGAPTALLYEIDKRFQDLFRLNDVFIEGESLSFFHDTDISAGTYDFVNYDVETQAVNSILVTYNYKSKSRKKDIQSIHQCIDTYLPALKKNGFPQWKQVSSSTPITWDYHSVIK
jgi:TRAP transporter TAXI family solute receptor